MQKEYVFKSRTMRRIAACFCVIFPMCFWINAWSARTQQTPRIDRTTTPSTTDTTTSATQVTALALPTGTSSYPNFFMSQVPVFSGVIQSSESGTGGFTVHTSNTDPHKGPIGFALRGINTYTGPTQITAGQLYVEGAGTLGIHSAVLIGAHGVLNITDAGVSATWQIEQSADGSISYAVSAGPYTYTPTVVSIGRLTDQDATDAFLKTSSVVIGNQNSLSIEGVGTSTEHVPQQFSGVISGSGTFIHNGGATELAGLNTYSGGTVLNNGVLSIVQFGTLGDSNGSVVVNGGILNLSNSTMTACAIGSLSGGSANASGLIRLGKTNLVINERNEQDVLWSRFEGSSAIQFNNSGSNHIVWTLNSSQKAQTNDSSGYENGSFQINGGSSGTSTVILGSDADLGTNTQVILNGGASENKAAILDISRTKNTLILNDLSGVAHDRVVIGESGLTLHITKDQIFAGNFLIPNSVSDAFKPGDLVIESDPKVQEPLNWTLSGNHSTYTGTFLIKNTSVDQIFNVILGPSTVFHPKVNFQLENSTLNASDYTTSRALIIGALRGNEHSAVNLGSVDLVINESGTSDTFSGTFETPENASGSFTLNNVSNAPAVWTFGSKEESTNRHVLPGVWRINGGLTSAASTTFMMGFGVWLDRPTRIQLNESSLDDAGSAILDLSNLKQTIDITGLSGRAQDIVVTGDSELSIKESYEENFLGSFKSAADGAKPNTVSDSGVIRLRNGTKNPMVWSLNGDNSKFYGTLIVEGGSDEKADVTVQLKPGARLGAQAFGVYGNTARAVLDLSQLDSLPPLNNLKVTILDTDTTKSVFNFGSLNLQLFGNNSIRGELHGINGNVIIQSGSTDVAGKGLYTGSTTIAPGASLCIGDLRNPAHHTDFKSNSIFVQANANKMGNLFFGHIQNTEDAFWRYGGNIAGPGTMVQVESKIIAMGSMDIANILIRDNSTLQIEGSATHSHQQHISVLMNSHLILKNSSNLIPGVSLLIGVNENDQSTLDLHEAKEDVKISALQGFGTVSIGNNNLIFISQPEETAPWTDATGRRLLEGQIFKNDGTFITGFNGHIIGNERGGLVFNTINDTYIFNGSVSGIKTPIHLNKNTVIIGDAQHKQAFLDAQSVVLQSGGRLEGIGLVQAAVINHSGIVSPGVSTSCDAISCSNGNLTIKGSYVQGESGTLLIAPGSQLIVEGPIDLHGNLIVDVGRAPLERNKVYEFLRHTGSKQIHLENLKQGSKESDPQVETTIGFFKGMARFTQPAGSASGIGVIDTGQFFLDEWNLLHAAITPTQKTTAKILIAQQHHVSTIFKILSSITGDNETKNTTARRILDETAAPFYANQLLIFSELGRAWDDQLHEIMHLKQSGLWIQPHWRHMELISDGRGGLKANNTGVMAGYIFPESQGFGGGASFDLEHVRVDATGAENAQLKGQLWKMGAYAWTQISKKTGLNASVSYGLTNKLNNTHTVDTQYDMTGQYAVHFDLEHVRLHYLITPVTPVLHVYPFIGFAHQNTQRSQFTETGNSDLLWTVQSEHQHRYWSELGVRTSFQVRHVGWDIQAAWEHSFTDRTPQFAVRMGQGATNAFDVIQGSSIGINSAVLSTNLRVRTQDLEFGISGQGRWTQAWKEYGVFAKISYQF